MAVMSHPDNGPINTPDAAGAKRNIAVVKPLRPDGYQYVTYSIIAGKKPAAQMPASRRTTRNWVAFVHREIYR